MIGISLQQTTALVASVTLVVLLGFGAPAAADSPAGGPGETEYCEYQQPTIFSCSLEDLDGAIFIDVSIHDTIKGFNAAVQVCGTHSVNGITCDAGCGWASLPAMSGGTYSNAEMTALLEYHDGSQICKSTTGHMEAFGFFGW